MKKLRLSTKLEVPSFRGAEMQLDEELSGHVKLLTILLNMGNILNKKIDIFVSVSSLE